MCFQGRGAANIPLLHGVAGWGVTRLASLPRGGAAIHLYCIAELTLSSATPNIIIYVILALATSRPDNMSLKIVVIS